MKYDVVVQPRAERDIKLAAHWILGQSGSAAIAVRWARKLRIRIATLCHLVVYCQPPIWVRGIAACLSPDQPHSVQARWFEVVGPTWRSPLVRQGVFRLPAVPKKNFGKVFISKFDKPFHRN